MQVLSLGEVKKAVEWAMQNVSGGGREEFLFAEHWKGSIDAGGTITNHGKGTYCIDYDNRCSCCGRLHNAGSVTFDAAATDVAAKKIHEELFIRASEDEKCCTFL